MLWRLGLLASLLGCGTAPSRVEDCGNTLDDDGNGLVDCGDPACAASTCVEICDDGFDNNLDDTIDCDDPQCDGRGCGEICTDGRDNDRNGARDCADPTCAEACDVDGDGFATVDGGGDDCDDDDAAVFPGADELCDGVDNDCNGLLDREDPNILRTEVDLYHLDADGDGYGDPFNAVFACEPPPGRVLDGRDCDDADASTNPDTPEICNGIDDNCDDLIDDQDPLVDLTGAPTWYGDGDGDGLGSVAVSMVACNQPPDHAGNADDCDDTTTAILGPSMWVYDGDGDGYGAGLEVGPYGCVPPSADHVPSYYTRDCDDTSTVFTPDATEICGDLLDYDCDGRDCAAWREDFESGNLSAEWTTGGGQPWFASAANPYLGAWSGESGNIGNNGQSWMNVEVDFPAGGSVSFWHTGSTEQGYDFLRFSIDGNTQVSRSGTWSWTYASYTVTPGTHTLEWRYTKDGSVTTGADTVWVDEIDMPGGD